MTKEQILEAIENMTVLELSELVEAIEERFGVSAAAPVAMAAMPGAPAAAEEAEQTEFDVIRLALATKRSSSNQGCPRDHWSWLEGS